MNSHVGATPMVYGLFATCLVISAVSATVSRAQPLESGMDYEKRIELAHRILEPIRDAAPHEENLRTRDPYFLTHYALLDPVWTANFILNNPPVDDGVLYDHNTTREIMRQAAVIPHGLLIRLVESTKADFARSEYALLALQNLPEEQSGLRNQIVELVLSNRDHEPATGPMPFASQLKIAVFAEDPQVVVGVQNHIDEFYKSGKAANLKRSVEGGEQSQYVEALLERFAPQAMKTEFQMADASWWRIGQTILRNDRLTKEEKVSRLRSIDDYTFGTQSYQVMGTASQLGLVALLDHELALRWAETAPNPVAKVWAKLTIAPAIARRDAPSATKLVRLCYDELRQLEKRDQDHLFYSVPPTDVASCGLHLVHAADPALVQECVAATIVIANRFQDASSRTTFFSAIAAIAPYSPEDAMSMFEAVSDDVSIGDASAFFKSLIAVAPHQVWDEYRDMPSKDRGGNDVRTQVRNTLIPALAEKNQTDFWYRLSHSYSGLDIAPEILSPEASSE